MKLAEKKPSPRKQFSCSTKETIITTAIINDTLIQDDGKRHYNLKSKQEIKSRAIKWYQISKTTRRKCQFLLISTISIIFL